MNNPNHTNISIVIPAFNAAETLRETVESVFKGNFEQGDEIIIIDDASFDTTASVIAEIRKTHPEIRATRNEKNLGCPATRNKGVRMATNSLILSLDADNVLAKGSVQMLASCLKDRNADAVAFGKIYYFIKSPKKITHTSIFPYPELQLADLFVGHTNPASTSQFLYRKSVWEKIGGYWEYGVGLHEGWGFAFKLLANNAQFAVCRHAEYFHRFGHNSLFTRENKKQNESSSIAMKMIEPFLVRFEEEDLGRIHKDEWKNIWFDRLEEFPIHIKDSAPGRKGVDTLSTRTKIMGVIHRLFVKTKMIKLVGLIKR